MAGDLILLLALIQLGCMTAITAAVAGALVVIYELATTREKDMATNRNQVN